MERKPLLFLLFTNRNLKHLIGVGLMFYKILCINNGELEVFLRILKGMSKVIFTSFSWNICKEFWVFSKVLKNPFEIFQGFIGRFKFRQKGQATIEMEGRDYCFRFKNSNEIVTQLPLKSFPFQTCLVFFDVFMPSRLSQECNNAYIKETNS